MAVKMASLFLGNISALAQDTEKNLIRITRYKSGRKKDI